jgi:hypothetical protein
MRSHTLPAPSSGLAPSHHFKLSLGDPDPGSTPDSDLAPHTPYTHTYTCTPKDLNSEYRRAYKLL